MSQHDLLSLAKMAHRQSLQSEDEADLHRQRRDKAIRDLRKQDPKRWTYPKIAQAVGCSPQLVAYIVKGR